MKYTEDGKPILFIEQNDLNISNPTDDMLIGIGYKLIATEKPIFDETAQYLQDTYFVDGGNLIQGWVVNKIVEEVLIEE